MREVIQAFARNWWLVLIRGLAAIVFGALAIVWPGATVTVLVVLFGAYVLVDGVFSIGSALLGASAGQRWGMQLISGIVGIGLGATTLIWPGVTVFVLLTLIAAWAFILGVLQIYAAIRLRKVIESEWIMIAGGVGSIIVSAVLVISPIGSLVTLAIVAGIFAILFGIALVGLSLRLKSWGQQMENLPA